MLRLGLGLALPRTRHRKLLGFLQLPGGGYLLLPDTESRLFLVNYV